MTAKAAADAPALKRRHSDSDRRYRSRTITPGTRTMVKDTSVRPCMCCGRPFNSEGKFNRLCQSCKDGAAYSMA